MLQAEWMRICDQQPMSRIDTSRYALDAPPVAKQADPQAWRRAVENAEAQHEHQNTRSVPAACSTALRCAPPPPALCSIAWPAHPPRPPSPRTTFGRLNNLELLQKHGANLWLAHINSLTAASAGCVAHPHASSYPMKRALTVASRFSRLASVQSDLASQVEAVNRKRKAEQVDVGPHLTRLESEWVGAVKKNLEIEGHCMRLENECAALQKRRDARGGHG